MIDCHIAAIHLDGIAADMARRVPLAMAAAIASVQTDLSPGAKTLALRLQTFVRKTTQQMSKRILTESHGESASR